MFGARRPGTGRRNDKDNNAARAKQREMAVEDCKRHDPAEARITDAATDSDLVIAYLLYALKDVRAISERSTQLLEGAIATLIEETRDRAPVVGVEQRRSRARTMLC
jgi:hypothetical protein